ncbi:hypothetical protein VFPFJ_02144 [Purpureocillium lilacinum]|uniref:Fe2OG dioxygenase domain-containing protein n=2 Tax=Purpureocillium lilacinum TaxID=33203 RepID=A0A179HUH2_PURLI|nr:hypothetical protein VFPFJ_02144 [Purpureocillium lilacinum]OAQ79260.1 hypothetical protein VFPBJ_07381 [Purpureocillium lilacinum]OAQ92983.1 hypothetical protein VFPFJ_02144 [Purpureocillium lilacinum]
MKAPHVVGPTTKTATRPTNPLPQYLNDEAKQTQREPFDPQRHLNFQPPARVITMREIGLEGHGISPNAVSEPFPLFTQEAVQQMRAEIFSDEVLRDCQFASTFNKNMIRGMGPARAPFVYSAWNSPELVSKISEVAGVDLVPSIDYEIATINISADDKPMPVTQSCVKKDGDGGSGKDPLGDGLSAVAWHYDSFPFVCVVMLSDCTDMVGGETALRTASGEVLKVRGPAMGTAVVLQGRYIEHQALKALGGRERIAMVTCFRPRSPHARDETVLTGVRAISHRSDLYAQYAEYRLEVLEERVRARLKAERLRERARTPFDVPGTRSWLLEQMGYLEAMLAEITED